MEVISIKDARKKKPKTNEETEKVEETLSFEEEMKRNEANKLRVEQERLKNNKKVLKTYRIKT